MYSNGRFRGSELEEWIRSEHKLSERMVGNINLHCVDMEPALNCAQVTLLTMSLTMKQVE